MQLHADYDLTAWDHGPLHPGALWQPSPLAGVERYMLDRDGAEVAVATSLVRYAPNSRFDPHSHAMGEEYLVLEGEFADEHGRYAPGTYVRNPPGSGHTPFSDPGCLIWVKLRQFHQADSLQSQQMTDWQPPATGLVQDALHQFAPGDDALQSKREQVAMLRAATDTAIELPACYGMQEVFVVRGAVEWQDAETITLGQYGWLRLAPGQPLRLRVLEPVVLLWKERTLWDRP
ncbi:MAG: cupin domain-containing protein [Pseudomonadales bacterium]